MNWGVFAFYEDWFKAEAYKRSPAKAAKDRLRAIIAADREAVPCGRLVPHVAGEFYPGRKGSLPFKVKPRWRLQWR